MTAEGDTLAYCSRPAAKGAGYRVSRPFLLPLFMNDVEKLSEKGLRSLRCSLTEHRNATFRSILASLHLQIHAQSVARTPFRTVSEGKFSEVAPTSNALVTTK
jgi:hypothetical protein